MPFTMPPINLGDPVLHYHVGGKVPCAAWVIEVGSRALSIVAFPPGIRGGKQIDGVRHKDDPDLMVVNEAGMWDYTPTHKTFLHLCKELMPSAAEKVVPASGPRQAEPVKPTK